MQVSPVSFKMLSSCNLQLFAGNRLLCQRVRTSQGCSRHLCQERIHFHNQPRAEIPELLIDVDAFLQVNATDTSLTLSLLGENSCFALCSPSYPTFFAQRPDYKVFLKFRHLVSSIKFKHRAAELLSLWGTAGLLNSVCFVHLPALAALAPLSSLQLMECKTIPSSEAACACACVKGNKKLILIHILFV